MPPQHPVESSWFERIPKVELHLHLEGAIPHAALWELVQRRGGDPGIPSVEALARRFTYTDFEHFIETWVWKNQFLREYDDFTFIAEAVAADLATQNVRYAEVFFSPGDYRRRGLAPGRLARAIRGGLDRCPQIEIALVPDLIRDHGPTRARQTLEEVHEAREFGIIGIGLGGTEVGFPPEPFAPVYRRARALGLHTSIHAGEAEGPESVWGAIRALHVDRIGHATRAIEDPSLVDHLAAAGIPLELCPISNLRTGVIRSLRDHPARIYFERGIPLCINTDDPKMFDTSLAAEYRVLEEELGFSRAEIQWLILQSVDHSWMSEERKRSMTEAFRAEFATLGEAV